ncbi:glycerophosphodiester phosphodiesterase [Burkholderiaceae bacterium DAT-1]|nr:glycerophosphodiester phosphodiesterase [Burkholderiaceae bacterium DAT-1]
MKILAHRGCHLDHPENSMDAFAAAVSRRFDGIETDVRASTDGQAVLIHDRVLKMGVAVSDLTHAELSHACGFTIPTLEDALDAFPGILWNIEIKTVEAAALAWPILRRYASSRRLLLTSFRHDVVIQSLSEIACPAGFLIASHPSDIPHLISACKTHPLISTVVWDFEILDNRTLAMLSDAGIHNAVYGPRTRAEHERLAPPLIDTVITDFPDFCGL